MNFGPEKQSSFEYGGDLSYDNPEHIEGALCQEEGVYHFIKRDIRLSRPFAETRRVVAAESPSSPSGRIDYYAEMRLLDAEKLKQRAVATKADDKTEKPTKK